MRPDLHPPPSRPAAIVFDLLNPIPFGFLVAALISDVVYANSGNVMWFKAAAWLIAAGLVFAIIPRLIDLVRVWFPGARPRSGHAMAAFWLYLAGIAAAIVNAFVHSRDAYSIVPEGVWLSIATVVLLAIATVLTTLHALKGQP
ncbi:hypothetical protein GT347_26730 [Xylophilus rhododendri]|uniref:DUF2231 domain-containing protein n=1 Tax=Xylophilus rhododendri TaxID=2697032 RepID=A0A857JC71_9BURK|nr:DUF2231 domain-containing protein [Xylophilus rhododendri]QHJ01268.1 hypothetical protein GT347_26730 [Xylophilus rhododendri]